MKTIEDDDEQTNDPTETRETNSKMTRNFPPNWYNGAGLRSQQPPAPEPSASGSVMAPSGSVEFYIAMTEPEMLAPLVWSQL